MENKDVDTEPTTIETPIPSENKPVILEQKTPLTCPIQSSPSPSIDLKKPSTPDRLKVPKAFKYPERYRSPTDSMMSPVTKGLLARARKGTALLPPSKNQHKIQDLRLQDVGLLQEINS